MTTQPTTAERCDQLFELGMKFNFRENAYVLDDFYVPNNDICLTTTEQWDNIVNKIKKEMEKRNVSKVQS